MGEDRATDPDGTTGGSQNASELLKSRLARGEITVDEYERIKRAIEDGASEIAGQGDAPSEAARSSLPGSAEGGWSRTIPPLRIDWPGVLLTGVKKLGLPLAFLLLVVLTTRFLQFSFATFVLGVVLAVMSGVLTLIAYAVEVFIQARRKPIALTRDSVSVGDKTILFRDLVAVDHKRSILTGEALVLRSRSQTIKLPREAYFGANELGPFQAALRKLAEANRAGAVPFSSADPIGAGNTGASTAGRRLKLATTFLEGGVAVGASLVGSYFLWKHRPLSSFADGLNRLAVDPDLVVLKEEAFYTALVLVALVFIYGLRKLLVAR